MRPVKLIYLCLGLLEASLRCCVFLSSQAVLLVCGCVCESGVFVCFQVLVMSPADIVKVRLQCQSELPDSRPKYRGPVHCLLSIARDEGLLGLYRGSAALALRDGPSFATYFLTYNSICDALRSADSSQPGAVFSRHTLQAETGLRSVLLL